MSSELRLARRVSFIGELEPTSIRFLLLAVERRHLQNTVQIGFNPLDVVEKEVKQYVFSVEGAREYERWLKVLRTQIDCAVANTLESERPMTGGGNTNGATGVSPGIRDAAEMVAAEVLRAASWAQKLVRYVLVRALVSIVIDSSCCSDY